MVFLPLGQGKELTTDSLQASDQIQAYPMVNHIKESKFTAGLIDSSSHRIEISIAFDQWPDTHDRE
jgi:hypothetical protein